MVSVVVQDSLDRRLRGCHIGKRNRGIHVLTADFSYPKMAHDRHLLRLALIGIIRGNDQSGERMAAISQYCGGMLDRGRAICYLVRLNYDEVAAGAVFLGRHGFGHCNLIRAARCVQSLVDALLMDYFGSL